MKLSRINTILLILIVLVNGYVILAPIVPTLTYMVQSHSSKTQQLTKAVRSRPSEPTSQSTTLSNTLTVPSMLLSQPVLEGSIKNQYSTLDKGIWRWPNGSTPDKGGNTVLIGHRFTYTNPKGVFYHMDKVKIGDEIGVTWSNKQYIYTVSSIREVQPTNTSIQDPTKDSRLTLFTCTPLWLPKHRLVVTASLQEVL